MCIQDRHVYDLMLRSKFSKEYVDFYRDIFKKNFPSNLSLSREPRIPKVMHRLWMGKRKMPELYKQYAENCRKLHPDWKQVLWSDKEVDELMRGDELYELYKKRRNIPAQKDRTLYEVLYRYGGVFMDTDFDCVQKLDELHYKYDFYASLEPGVSWSRVPVQTIAIVGSKPGNEVFKESIKRAKKFYNDLQREGKRRLIEMFRLFVYYLGREDGRGVFQKIRLALDGINARNVDAYNYCTDIVSSTVCKRQDPRFIMMHSLASAFKDQYRDGERSIVFPASYFNPVFPRSYDNYSLFDKIFMIDLKLKKDIFCFKAIQPETIAIQDFND